MSIIRRSVVSRPSLSILIVVEVSTVVRFSSSLPIELLALLSILTVVLVVVVAKVVVVVVEVAVVLISVVIVSTERAQVL